MNDLQLSIKLTTNGGKVVVKDLELVERAQDKLNRELHNTHTAGAVASSGLNKVSAASKTLEQHSMKASVNMERMAVAGYVLTGSFITATGAINALNRTDNFNVLTQRIKTATNDTHDFVSVNKALYQITQDNGVAMSTTVELFQRLASSRTELKATNKDMLKLVNTVQKLGVIGGSTKAAMDAGLMQLSQGLSASVLRAEEFNSIQENLPEVANRIAKGLGVSRGVLRQMVLEGKVLSKDVFDALLKQSSAINEEHKNIAVSVAVGWQNINNSVDSSLTRLDQAKGTTKSLAIRLQEISKIIDELDITQLQQIVAFLGSGLFGGGALLLFSKFGINLATMAEGMIAARKQSALLAANFVNIKSKATLATVAVNGLKFGVRTLLGPIGLAIGAGMLLYEAFAPTELEKSAAAVDKLADANEKLAQAAKEAAQKVEPNTNVNDHLQAAYEQQALLIAQSQILQTGFMDIAKSGFATAESLTATANQMQVVNEKLEEQKRLIASLLIMRQLQTEEEKRLAAEAKIAPVAERELVSLQQQIALYGEISIEKQLHYKITEGHLKGVNVETAKQLIAAAKLLDIKRKQRQQDAQQQEIKNYLNDLKQQNELLKYRLTLSKEEYALKAAMARLDGKTVDDGMVAQIAEQLAMQDKLNASLLLQQEIQGNGLDDFIDDVTRLGDAFGQTGNVIVDAFGSIGQQITQLVDNQDKYEKSLERLASKKAAIASDENLSYRDKHLALNKLAKAESDLASRNLSQQLSSYAAMSSAAAQMFKEDSKGRETMMKLSQAFTAAELINSATRAGAYALEAIAAAFAAPWPVGFVTGAAMIGIMAGLGVFNGSSGSAPDVEQRQQTQGTGTVFGSDGKSNSIDNAFQRQLDLELDQYAMLTNINNNLSDLNNNLTQVTASLVSRYGRFDGMSYDGQLGTVRKYGGYNRNDASSSMYHLAGGTAEASILTQFAYVLDKVFGGALTKQFNKIIGSFNKTKTSLLDSGLSIDSQTLGEIIANGMVDASAYYDIKTKKSSWWGLSSQTTYSTEYQGVDSQVKRELGLIFASIGDSITGALDVLQLDVDKQLADFVVSIDHLSFKDLSGEEIQAELQAVISQTADKMATWVLPAVDAYQKVGEGLFETLIRLAQEQAVFNHVLDITSQSLRDLAGLDAITVTQQIIGYAGGIEALSNSASAFFNAFYDENEKFLFLQAQLNAQFGALGRELPATAAGFKDMVLGLDLANEAEAKLYAQLLAMSDALGDYYKQVEANEQAKEDELKKREAEAQAIVDFNRKISDSLRDLEASEVEKEINRLMAKFDDDLAQAIELGADVQLLETFYGKQRAKIIETHLSNAENTFNDKIKDIADELAKLVDAIGNSKNGIAASIRQIQRDMGGFDELGFLNGNVNSLYGQLGTGSIAEQIDRIDDLNSAIFDRYQFEQSKYLELQTAAEDRYNSELDRYHNLKNALKSVSDFSKTFGLSGSSPLNLSQQLGIASSNFYSDLRAALNDKDIDAISNIGTSASNYADIAQQYYGSSPNMTAIFNAIQQGLNQVAALGVEVPEIPTEVDKYQTSSIDNQLATIAELEGLNVQLAALELQAQDVAAEQTKLATEQFNQQRDLIVQQNEIAKSQLAEQRKTNAELAEANAKASVTINLLQQQVRESNKAYRAVQENLDRISAAGGTR